LEDFCSSLLGHLRTLLYFLIVLDYRTFFFCGLYYSVYPGPSETFRGSNFLGLIFITLVYPLSHCAKKGGVIFIWTGIVFLTGEVIFVPKSPKGEFVNL
jgi:hypothetical protein